MRRKRNLRDKKLPINIGVVNNVIIRIFFRAFMSCVLLLGVALANAQASRAPRAMPSGPYPDERKILDLLNQERQKAGLAKLAWDQHAAEAAREHSMLMAEGLEIGHQFPGEPALAQRIAATGARFTGCAENVAVADSPEEIHMALMHSPGHRANIMSPRYNGAGIGVVERRGRLYVTQDFAFITPMYSETQFYDAFVDAFNRARKSKGHRALDARPDTRLHGAACATDGNIQNVVDSVSGNAKIILFTLSEPDKLPDKLYDYVSSARLERMNVGLCYRPDRQYGSANFWVAVAFYE